MEVSKQASLLRWLDLLKALTDWLSVMKYNRPNSYGHILAQLVLEQIQLSLESANKMYS